MSAHHEEHSINGPKPVSFTVPLILAIVAITIIVLILSVCDPKTGHHELQEVHPSMEQKHDAGTQHSNAENAPDAAGETTGADHH
jgi:hypothetical protein